MLNRDEKIENEIIKPKDKLIQELYQENKALHKELSKQVNTVKLATRYEKEYMQLIETNVNLKFHNRVLSEQLENKDKELENREYKIEQKYKSKIKNLEKENKNLNRMIDRFKSTIKKFIKWVSCKFSYSSEDEIIRDFERETYTILMLKNSLILNNLKGNVKILKYTIRKI